MPDYRNMSAIEAVRHAKDASGLTIEEIARAAGISAAIMRRYLHREDGYSPGLERIPSLCRAMRNRILIQWLEAQLEGEGEAAPAKSRAQVLTAVVRAAACMGDAQRRLADSEETGIDPAGAREVRGLLQDVIEGCRRAQGMLAEQAACRCRAQTEPLASLGARQNRRRWWARARKFFEGW